MAGGIDGVDLQMVGQALGMQAAARYFATQSADMLDVLMRDIDNMFAGADRAGERNEVRTIAQETFARKIQEFVAEQFKTDDEMMAKEVSKAGDQREVRAIVEKRTAARQRAFTHIRDEIAKAAKKPPRSLDALLAAICRSVLLMWNPRAKSSEVMLVAVVTAARKIVDAGTIKKALKGESKTTEKKKLKEREVKRKQKAVERKIEDKRVFEEVMGRKRRG